MVRVKPFRGFRPPAHLAEAVAAPPYDVMDSAEAREVYARRGETCFLRVNKPEVDVPADISQYDVKVYDMGSENLQHFISSGWLTQDPTPCFYVYEQEQPAREGGGLRMQGHTQRGVCCGVPVEDYAMGVIKRHEKTTVKKENDRTRLTHVQNANVGPVFLTYRDCPQVDRVVRDVVSTRPDTSFVAEGGVRHTVWVVRDPQDVYHLRKAFESVDHTYIADGHHRSASAFRVGEMKMKEAVARGEVVTGEEPFNFFLAVLFPATQLRIMEYNRVVKDLAGFTKEEFLEQVRVCFEVEPLGDGERPEPRRRRQVGMCLGGEWYRLTAREGTFEPDNPVKGLDVQILYDNLLQPVLNIGNPRADERIKYVGGVRGSAHLQELVTGPEAWAVAFCMYPVSINEVMDIADADSLMPPKATWFEPKLCSGLVVRVLDDA